MNRTYTSPAVWGTDTDRATHASTLTNEPLHRVATRESSANARSSTRSAALMEYEPVYECVAKLREHEGVAARGGRLRTADPSTLKPTSPIFT